MHEKALANAGPVLIAEAASFVAMWKDLKLPDGRDRVVRHGHGPHRTIQTGVGPVEVRRAKVRDRGDVGAEEKIRFSSSILPKWARRTKSLDALLPVLYRASPPRPLRAPPRLAIRRGEPGHRCQIKF